MEEKKTSEAMRKAINKYDSKWERVNCRFPEGTKNRINKAGYKSINQFIIQAVLEKLDNIEKLTNKAQ